MPRTVFDRRLAQVLAMGGGLIAILSTSLIAQDDPKPDPVRVALNQAKMEYTNSKKQADDALSEIFDRQASAIRDDSKLDVEEKIQRLERLNGQKAALEKSGTMPTSPALKKAAMNYELALSTAKKKCGDVFKAKADNALSDVNKAKAILAERDEFFRLAQRAQPSKAQKDAVEKGFEETKFAGETELVQGVTLKIGDPQLTLIWDTKGDLDLHVVEPGGKELYWENRQGDLGGELDVDDVDGFGPENIYFSTEGKAKGEYRWFVHYYGGLGGGSIPTRWRVRVKQGGKMKVYEGSLRAIGERSAVYTLKIE